MQDRVTVTQVGIERGEGGKFAPDGIVGEALPSELLTPGNHMGAGHVPELFRLPQACEDLKVFDVLLVGAAGVRVSEIGEPFEFRRNLRQILELGGGQLHWQDRSQGVRGRRGHSAWSSRAGPASCADSLVGLGRPRCQRACSTSVTVAAASATRLNEMPTSSNGWMPSWAI